MQDVQNGQVLSQKEGVKGGVVVSIILFFSVSECPTIIISETDLSS